MSQKELTPALQGLRHSCSENGTDFITTHLGPGQGCANIFEGF